jgi:glycosyltransferase involved in cell wall biosynthesis
MSKVSIIIPYKTDRGWLSEAVESVHNQTHKDIELILSQSDNRIGYNINRGVEMATGEYIKYFAEDDLLTPNCIEDSLKAIDGYDFIHGNAINFFTSGREELYKPPVTHPTVMRMVHSNVFHGGTMFYRADVFKRFGMFNESLWTGEEYDFNLMILSKGAKVGYCDEILFRYRRHKAQKSLGNRDRLYQDKRTQAINKIKQQYV